MSGFLFWDLNFANFGCGNSLLFHSLESWLGAVAGPAEEPGIETMPVVTLSSFFFFFFAGQVRDMVGQLLWNFE